MMTECIDGCIKESIKPSVKVISDACRDISMISKNQLKGRELELHRLNFRYEGAFCFLPRLITDWPRM